MSHCDKSRHIKREESNAAISIASHKHPYRGQLRHVYSADTTIDSNGRRDWIYTASVGKSAPDLKKLQDRISIDPSFLLDVQSLVKPGTTLVLTNAPVGNQTHSGTGFKILTAANS